MVVQSVSILPRGRTKTNPSCGTRKLLASTAQCSNAMMPFQIWAMTARCDRATTTAPCLAFYRRYPTLSRFKSPRRYCGVRVRAWLLLSFLSFLSGLGVWYLRKAGAFPSLGLGFSRFCFINYIRFWVQIYFVHKNISFWCVGEKRGLGWIFVIHSVLSLACLSG